MYNVPSIENKRKANTAFWLWIGIHALLSTRTLWFDSNLIKNFSTQINQTLNIIINYFFIGCIQWLILRRYFPKITRWIWLTIIANLIIILADRWFNLYHREWTYEESIIKYVFLNFVITVTFSTFIGSIQSFAFKNYVRKSHLWIVAYFIQGILQGFFIESLLYFLSVLGLENIADLIIKYDIAYILIFTTIAIIPQALILRRFVAEYQHIK